MKKTFQKTLIAAAAGVALMSAVGTASANSLLFPYFNTDTATGVQSVLSLSNTSTVGAGSNETIHYVYNYGASCTHYDANGLLTPNDILSHSIASPTLAGGFGLAVGGDKSTPVYFPEAGKTGFLVTSTKTTNTTGLRGSMAIVEPVSGLVTSYAGIDNGLGTQATSEGDFSAFTDVSFPLTFLPPTIVTTQWYTVVVGNMYPAINTGADWKATASFSNNGFVYNNDEVAYSGTKTATVTCAGMVTPDASTTTGLMTSAQNAIIGQATGGLIRTTATMGGSGVSVGTGVVMMKMQRVLPVVGGNFASKQFLHREQAGL